MFMGDTSVIYIYFLHADMMSAAVLFMNRYTSMCHPTKHATVCL
jgi:hypothetical protein